MDEQTKKIMALFAGLGAGERATLIAFAEFLCERQGAERDMDRAVEPLWIERPESETVPEALKRLHKTYAMLEASDLLTEAAELMTQHVMQGRAATDVIDDLQALFERHYQLFKSE
jgi:gamma-glutamyltranspeptidase